jgi:acid stress-induced BolA-like protein IbaG/YrbA
VSFCEELEIVWQREDKNKNKKKKEIRTGIEDEEERNDIHDISIHTLSAECLELAT